MCAQYIEQDSGALNRKRFDSVAMASRSEQHHNEADFTTSAPSWQQQQNVPASICETGKQRAAQRPAGLPFDCWNSPLCPRNMPQNGSARSAGQTICNPGASLNNNVAVNQSTNDTSNSSRNETPTTDISIPADSPPFDARPSLKRARTDLSYETPLPDEAPSVKAAPKEKRLPHHVIERRYRENLNTQIEQLRAAVPSTTSSCLTLDMEDIGPSYASANAARNTAAASNNGIRPLSKAGVIAHAAEYMRQLSAQNDEVEKRNAELRMTVEALRRLVNCEGCGVVQQLIDAGS